ncbi:MAG: helix-turn-helix transcriptional regulator [Rhizobiaceae bacterium]
MFSHRQVWAAIDALAQQNDMSVSRLARNAGLDSTTFNKSKRITVAGRQRWPSTESLSKIMQATNSTMENFMTLIEGGIDGGRSSFDSGISGLGQAGLNQIGFAEELPPTYRIPFSVPLLGLAQAGSGGFFDDAGLPTGEGWDAVDFPRPDGDSVYALEISGDSMLPLYRDGDRIIVSPNASIRRGDRVVLRTHEGEVMAKVLSRKTAKVIELDSLNPEHENRIFELVDVDWVARIVWASQ